MVRVNLVCWLLLGLTSFGGHTRSVHSYRIHSIHDKDLKNCKPYELWWIGDHEGFSVVVNTLLFMSTSRWVGFHQMPVSTRDCGIHIHFAPNRNMHYQEGENAHCVTDFVEPKPADHKVASRVTWDCDSRYGLEGNKHIVDTHQCAFFTPPGRLDVSNKWLRRPKYWGLETFDTIDVVHPFHPSKHDCVLAIAYHNVSTLHERPPTLKSTPTTMHAAQSAKMCLFGSKPYNAVHWRRGDQLISSRCVHHHSHEDNNNKDHDVIDIEAWSDSVNCERDISKVVQRFSEFAGNTTLYIATNERNVETLALLTKAGFRHHGNAQDCFALNRRDTKSIDAGHHVSTPLGFFVDLELMSTAERLWLPGISYVHVVIRALVASNDAKPIIIT